MLKQIYFLDYLHNIRVISQIKRLKMVYFIDCLEYKFKYFLKRKRDTTHLDFKD